MSPKPIPDRWIPYKACGKAIEGTRIICFKVPLKRTVQARVVAPEDIWDIKTLLKTIPKLRSVIDLTNTARYYDPKDLTSAGIQHTKILMPGREIPPESKVAEFMNALDVFYGKDQDSLIGVHCTHGLNRTGYMVCRYMRDRLGIPAKEAIRRFETARGYEIERKNYIADLVGNTPPPPDVGKSTVIKPIVNSNNVQYCSPLNYYENEVDDMHGNDSRRNRFGNSSSSTKNLNYNWRHRQEPSMSSNNENRTDSSSRNSSHKYDYKYDY